MRRGVAGRGGRGGDRRVEIRFQRRRWPRVPLREGPGIPWYIQNKVLVVSGNLRAHRCWNIRGGRGGDRRVEIRFQHRQWARVPPREGPGIPRNTKGKASNIGFPGIYSI